VLFPAGAGWRGGGAAAGQAVQGGRRAPVRGLQSARSGRPGPGGQLPGSSCAKRSGSCAKGGLAVLCPLLIGISMHFQASLYLRVYLGV